MIPLPPSRFTPGLYRGVPDDAYHGDHGSLSSSGARTLLADSPAAFRQALDTPVVSPVYDLGHAAHQMVLGAGPDIVRLDFPDRRTNAYKQAAAEVRDAGGVPMLAKPYDDARKMADAVLAHERAGRLFEDGHPEQSLWWRDPDTGVMLRARPDFVPNREGRMILVDLKTAATANPKRFGKHAADLGYHVQDAWYRRAVVELGLDDAPAFLFVIVEKTPPHLVSVVELHHDAVRLGDALGRKAVRRFADCVAADTWPGYDPTIHYIDLPRWTYTSQEALL